MAADIHAVDILEPPLYLPSGKTQGIVEAIRAGAWLHVTNIWLYRWHNGAVEVLLQQRSHDSPVFAGMLDCAAAGYLHAGEAPADGALRELEEELGVRPDRGSVVSFGRHFNAGLDWRGRERKWVINKFVAEMPCQLSELRLSPEEVEAAYWIRADDIALIGSGDTINISGLTNSGEAIEANVARKDFVPNVDDYHYTMVERISTYAKKMLEPQRRGVD